MQHRPSHSDEIPALPAPRIGIDTFDPWRSQRPASDAGGALTVARPRPANDQSLAVGRERVELEELGFDLTGPWTDRSIHRYEMQSNTGAKRALTMARVDAPEGLLVGVIAADELAGIARSLPDFVLVSREAVTLAVGHAISVVFHSGSGTDALTQRMTIFRSGSTTWNMRATWLRTDVDAAPFFERAMRGLAPRDRQRPSTRPPPRAPWSPFQRPR